MGSLLSLLDLGYPFIDQLLEHEVPARVTPPQEPLIEKSESDVTNIHEFGGRARSRPEN